MRWYYYIDFTCKAYNFNKLQNLMINMIIAIQINPDKFYQALRQVNVVYLVNVLKSQYKSINNKYKT